MASIFSVIFLSLALTLTTMAASKKSSRRHPSPTTPPPPSPLPPPPPPSPLPPPPPPPSVDTFPLRFYRCLIKNTPQSHIPFSAIYAPSLNATAFSLQLNSTPINQRCLKSSVPKPLLIFAPLDENQVPAFVVCAKYYRVDIRLRSGGNHLECLSFVSFLGKPFLVLDLQNLQDVTIDLDEKTAWVQSGATVGQLDFKVANESGGSLAFPAGVWMNLGIGGLVTGGGQGPLMRTIGLAIDVALEARVVLANGTVVHSVNNDEDAVFWALLGGGGGNFVIILAWKFKLLPVTPVVTVFSVDRVLDDEGMSTLYAWQNKAANIEWGAFITVEVHGVPSSNVTVATYKAIYQGDTTQLMRLMNKKFSELQLKETDCTGTTWIGSMLFISGYPEGTNPEYLLKREPPTSFKYSMKANSFFARKRMSIKGLKKLRDFHTQSFSLRTTLTPLGGKMGFSRENATPYPHRYALYMMDAVNTWDGGASLEIDTLNMDFMRRFYKEMLPYIPDKEHPGEADVSYMDLDLGRAENCTSNCSCPYLWGPKYYNDNFQRLVQVKADVDPSNFLNFEQSIPLPGQEGKCLNMI